MPNILETASELDTMLSTGWGGQTPIAIDNIQYKEIEGEAYLSTKFIPFEANNVNVDAARQKRIRTEGIYFINIKTPLWKGVGLAYQYALDIKTIMENKNPLPNLFTTAVTVQRIGDDKDGWFNLTCDVPFISDDIQ